MPGDCSRSCCSPRAGSAAGSAGLTREQMDGNADLGNMMTERFNVGGALLLKLFGRRDEEDERYSREGRPWSATSASGSP